MQPVYSTILVIDPALYYVPGVIISLFLTLILLSKKNKTQADNILMLWLLSLGVHISLIYTVVTGFAMRYPFLLGLAIPLPLIQGPFLFLYVSSLTNQINRKYNLLHFVPVGIVYLILIPFYLLPGEEKIRVYEQDDSAYRDLIRGIFAAVVISGLVYITGSLIKLNRHRKNIGNQFSNTEKIDLLWLRYLTIGIAVIWSVVVSSLNDNYIYAAATLFVFFIGYFGIKQVGIFTNKETIRARQAAGSTDVGVDMPQKEHLQGNIAPSSAATGTAIIPGPADQPDKVKYSKSGLSDEMALKIHRQLALLMTAEKPYTNPDLTLAQLSKQLQVPDNYLSQVINSLEQKNFYDYINGQRVEAFKRIVVLPGNKPYTLLSLAFECGFNSKTSFNRNFKTYTGLSPSEYLEMEHIRLS